jgi:hypothetical protein
MTVLSVAWRLLLALALTVSPILGMAGDGGCGHAGSVVGVGMIGDDGDDANLAGDDAGAAPVASLAMPDCADMASMPDMASVPAKAPQGKTDPAPGAPGHAACATNACCLGGAIGMTALALALDAPPARPLRAPLRDTTRPSPPRGPLLRPPIA